MLDAALIDLSLSLSADKTNELITEHQDTGSASTKRLRVISYNRYSETNEPVMAGAVVDTSLRQTNHLVEVNS